MVDTPKFSMPRLMDSQPLRVDFRTRGRSGLRSNSGWILDETERELQGRRGLEVFREMGDNDSTVGSVLYTIDKIARQVKWRVDRASDHPRDREAADFLDECREDMDMTWTDIISEAMSMLQYGFSLMEIVYKRRCGDAPEPWMRSRFKDGRIGWRGMPGRAQETIYRWLTDELGNFEMVEQISPPDYQTVTIPMEKLLLFRTSTHKNSPLGRSVLRSAWRAWRMKRAIENIEGIGIERDLAGLPVAWVPPEVLAGATDEDAQMLAAIKNIVTNVRRDEQEGVIMPISYDEAGNQNFKFELMTSGGARNFDTDKVIARYDSRIAMCALADFLLLGQGTSGAGSWAMHSDKTKLFCQSITAHLSIVAETFNRFAVQRLFALNSFAIDELPKIVFSDPEQVDLKTIGEFVAAIAGAGAPLFPNEQLETRLCEMAGLPPPTPPGQGEPLKEPLGTPSQEEITEIHEGDPDPEAPPVADVTGVIPKATTLPHSINPTGVPLPTPASTGRV